MTNNVFSEPLIPSAEDATPPKFEMSFATGTEEIAMTEYYIDPVLPRNQVVGVYGRGEAGKSTLISTWCASASHQNVVTLWVSSEEDTPHISVRYHKSGGQQGTLIPMTHKPRKVGKVEHVTFDLYEHLETAIQQANELATQTGRELGIVVLDAVVTLVQFEKGENANDDKSVKRLMAHLTDLSHKYGLTIFALGHLNKNATGKFREDMVTGSAAWTNSPRVAYAVQKDRNAESDYEGIAELVKANNGTRFAFRFQTEVIHTLHTRANGHDEVLCKARQIGDIVWGNAAIEEMIHENEPSQGQTPKQSREVKKQARVDAALHAICQGGCSYREEIQMYAMSFGAQINQRHFIDHIDEALRLNHGVTIHTEEHNRKRYEG